MRISSLFRIFHPGFLLLARLFDSLCRFGRFLLVFIENHPAMKQRLVFWMGAILVGILVVLLTVLGEWAGDVAKLMYSADGKVGFVVTPIVLALTAWVTFRFFPGSERSGVPQVKTALEVTHELGGRSRLVSIRIAVGKMILPIVGLFAGASVGLGGPAVQMGASVMTSMGKAVRFPPHYMEKGLILAGSSAGFAAMFSAPLAGIVFAIEEMGRALEERMSSLVLTAIIFAGITAYAFLDNYIFFHDRTLVLPWGEMWLAVPLCGVLGGLAGGSFSRILISGGRWLAQTRISIVVIAFICGIVIAALGYFSSGVTLGTGYDEAKAILHGQVVDPWYPFLKMGASIATFFSGIPAGIFVPSLATGAGLGQSIASWFPVAPTAIMVLLGMTAYFSGMLQSPITSFVIVMEITDTHEILIPMMAAAFFATATSRLVCPVPLYRALCDAYVANEDNKETIK